uniref:Uncharacterized protein n=1 Tax=Medicago truncatula TaxID=3880 RepID=A2Q5N7_MEDTR|nr:hypothetical protein MtrDRAFT_AC167711g40v2 [Medicago truncatula]
MEKSESRMMGSLDLELGDRKSNSNTHPFSNLQLTLELGEKKLNSKLPCFENEFQGLLIDFWMKKLNTC